MIEITDMKGITIDITIMIVIITMVTEDTNRKKAGRTGFFI